MIISNFIWNFIQENIGHSDNNPTKFSVLSYAYFQMLYNVGTLFEKNGIESKDRVIPLKKCNEIRKGIFKYPKKFIKNLFIYCAQCFYIKIIPKCEITYSSRLWTEKNN
jgi:hypothetical protein